jgi:peptidoglycan/LPS O-acetylase OafA/YrhL
LWVISIFAIVASVRNNEAIDSWLSPKGHAVIRQVGLITYPLYLLHELIGSVLMAGMARLGVPLVACLGLAVLLLIGAAFLISRFGEPALRKWLFVPVFDRLGVRPT